MIEPVGKGGFAKVYRARDPLSRDVALKLFPVTPENAAALSAASFAKARSSPRSTTATSSSSTASSSRTDSSVCGWSSSTAERMEDELRAAARSSAEEAALIGVDVCHALGAVHGAAWCTATSRRRTSCARTADGSS